MTGLVEGELEWADILFLVALILFAVAAFFRLSARAVDGALMALGAMAVATGLLLL